MVEQIANFGHTTLNEALDASETGVDVTDGSVFPASGNFRVRVDDEIMLVTSRATNTLTVTRGAESTAAVTHSNGADIDARLTAAALVLAIEENSPASGTSFPGSPTTGDRYRRTDIDYIIFFYDGTRWVSEQIFRGDMHNVYANIPIADIGANLVVARLAFPTDYDIFTLNAYLVYRVKTTNNGSNYWTFDILYQPSGTNAGSVDSSAVSADTFTAATIVLDDVVDTNGGTDILAQLRVGDTGGPGDIDSWECALYYRLIAT